MMITLHTYHFATRIRDEEIVQYEGLYEKDGEDSATWMFVPSIKSIGEEQLRILSEKESASPGERVSTTWAFDTEGHDLQHMEVDRKIVKINITIHAHSVGFFEDKTSNTAVAQIFARLAHSIADTTKSMLPNLDIRQSQFRLIQPNGTVRFLTANLDPSLDRNNFYVVAYMANNNSCAIL
jgi:hypothetical protein